jgi:Do/DeqQ family serine protease
MRREIMSGKRLLHGKGRVATLFSTLFTLAMLVFLGACSRQNPAVHFASTSDPGGNSAAPINNPPATGAAVPGVSYADVVSRVSPAVITIHSEIRQRAPQQYPFLDDPLFREFFNQRGMVPQPPPERRAHGLGSGVIISTDGYIITNHHVIDGADQIKVDLNDGRTLDAKLVGTDPPSDLAVLKIAATNLPVLALGDSDKVRVGDVVLAIGNPLGIGQTVTMGIISAKGRQTGLQGSGSFEDFLQTDAPINQGNSGGALVSTNSELIGINSQILSQSGGSIGIGFAIPSNMARTVSDTLVKNGKVRRGQLGITVVKAGSEPAKALGVKESKGVVVAQIAPDGPADKAGLKAGDVITSFNGIAVDDLNTFRNHVASTAPGTEVILTVLRDGREQQLRATLGEFVPQPEQPR